MSTAPAVEMYMDVWKRPELRDVRPTVPEVLVIVDPKPSLSRQDMRLVHERVSAVPAAHPIPRHSPHAQCPPPQQWGPRLRQHALRRYTAPCGKVVGSPGIWKHNNPLARSDMSVVISLDRISIQTLAKQAPGRPPARYPGNVPARN